MTKNHITFGLVIGIGALVGIILKSMLTNATASTSSS